MRVIVADDEQQVRSALKFILEQEPTVDMVFEFETLIDLLERMTNLCPDVLIFDWDMRLPVLNNALVQTMRRRCPDVLILAMSCRPESEAPALRSGVDAYISKGDPPERLLQNVRKTASKRFQDTCAALPETP
jgi:DNA-binding NarL/FixJ family response regulator